MFPAQPAWESKFGRHQSAGGDAPEARELLFSAVNTVE